MNDIESALVKHISEHPGVHHNELVRALDTTPDKLQRVSQKLREDGIVIINDFHGKTHYFPSDCDPWMQEIIALLRRETSREILLYLLEERRSYPAEMAEEIGVARSTLEWHLDRLIDARLIDKLHDGRQVVLILTEKGRVRKGIEQIDSSISALDV